MSFAGTFNEYINMGSDWEKNEYQLYEIYVEFTA